MHIHKLEKIWLVFGIGMLGVFLLILGISTFSYGLEPPSAHQAVNMENLYDTPPFDELGLNKLNDKEYEAILTAYVFGFNTGDEEFTVPVGSTVHFKATSPDVVHGFEIPGTNANMMVVPGIINHVTYTFDEPGEYLILCNEYCGVGHEIMQTTITVK
ncbi:cytochrome c oxidase subunit II [Longirhabdus pacifica]|uniref:cytochrome c oxidase subunit II n=1 Tax=Longirhabdus pacifica TaxID=2305227 RepID=UPI001008DE22|nr:cytochrome c oxidase subunit II [Longirhabdus pacifica]